MCIDDSTSSVLRLPSPPLQRFPVPMWTKQEYIKRLRSRLVLGTCPVGVESVPLDFDDEKNRGRRRAATLTYEDACSYRARCEPTPEPAAVSALGVHDISTAKERESPLSKGGGASSKSSGDCRLPQHQPKKETHMSALVLASFGQIVSSIFLSGTISTPKMLSCGKTGKIREIQGKG